MNKTTGARKLISQNKYFLHFSMERRCAKVKYMLAAIYSQRLQPTVECVGFSKEYGEWRWMEVGATCIADTPLHSGLVNQL